MSKKKERAWFVCPQWPELVSRHYADDAAAARALGADVKVLARIRQQTPVARSTLVKMLHRLGSVQRTDSSLSGLIVDTRSR